MWFKYSIPHDRLYPVQRSSVKRRSCLMRFIHTIYLHWIKIFLKCSSRIFLSSDYSPRNGFNSTVIADERAGFLDLIRIYIYGSQYAYVDWEIARNQLGCASLDRIKCVPGFHPHKRDGQHGVCGSKRTCPVKLSCSAQMILIQLEHCRCRATNSLDRRAGIPVLQQNQVQSQHPVEVFGAPTIPGSLEATRLVPQDAGEALTSVMNNTLCLSQKPTVSNYRSRISYRTLTMIINISCAHRENSSDIHS
jgi:hypothetical protein